jgi:hypothetical protein
MACCKIGCGKDAVSEQEVAFINHQGYVIRTKIQWCEEHKPESIFEDYSQASLMKQKGY